MIPSWNGDGVFMGQESHTSHRNQMKVVFPSIVLASFVVTAGCITPVRAGDVDPSIHKLCVEAKDYAGCVRSMKGDTSVRVINSQGADVAEGNQCPSGYAYVGGGNCQEVKCIYNSRDRYKRPIANCY